jgi:2-haloacid dehalogenase
VPNRTRLVLFDVNGTLADLRGLLPRLRAAGAGDELLGEWFAGVLRDGFALTAAGSRAEFAQVARDGLRGLLTGPDRPPHEAARAADDVVAGFGDLPAHDDVPSAVRALRAAGYRLATLTNGTAATSEAVAERAGVGDCFEAHLDVAEARRWKPAPEAYARALETLRVSSGEALLVSAHPWDVHGARRAGLATAWVHRSPTSYPTAMDAPDHEVASLDLLAGALCP